MPDLPLDTLIILGLVFASIVGRFFKKKDGASDAEVDAPAKESQKNELEMTAFGAALASGIISFHDFTSKDCRNCKQLVGAIARVKQHLEKEHKKFDSEIDKMHIKFAQEMEELDLKIIRDRKEFKQYLISLIYAEEYNKLRHSVTTIYETLDAKSRYEDSTE